MKQEEDNDMALCWSSNHVERALGDTEMFFTEAGAQYQTDMLSGNTRLGGRKRYLDGRGVLGISQAVI